VCGGDGECMKRWTGCSLWSHRLQTSNLRLLFYCTSYRLNMFRAFHCPSSGARDYDVDSHVGRFVLGFLYVGGQVRLGSSSVWAAG